MPGWTIPLDQLARRMRVDTETVARKLMLQLFSAVVSRSPVDTGRFRANWNVSLGVPNYETTDSTAESRSRAQVQGVMMVALNRVVYLSNGLPYAAKLEYDGWSKQAPAGMVRVTMAELDSYLRKALA